MIWFYTPAFIPESLNEVYIPDLSDPDTLVDWEVARSLITMHEPAYVTGITRPGRITVKRSMNDTVRTYVTYDRKSTAHREISIKFDHLTTDRMKALEHFIISTEGKHIGYRDPDNKYYAALITSSDIAITTDGGAVPTWGDNIWAPDSNINVVSELGSVEIQLLLIKEGVI